MPDTNAQAKKVEEDHAKTGKPVSPTEDPTDHSKPASEIAAQVNPAGKSGAAVNAASIEAVAKDDEDAKPQGLAGKIRKSELYAVNDHVSGGGLYIGISPQNDPKATEAQKRLSSVNPLSSVAPRTGMQVRPKDGDAFSVGDGFGPDSVPSDWQKVVRPDGSPLFP